MKFDEIGAYLALLTNALRRRGVSNLRMVDEARGHLTDDVEDGIRRGLDPLAAQCEALTRFGSAESIAATFVTETYGLFDRLVWLAATIVGAAIAHLDSRPPWDDTTVTAFALAMASAICGIVAPRRPWRWALAVGIWTPVFAVGRWDSPDLLVLLVVALFSLSGAYAGAAMRCARSQLSPYPDGEHAFHDTASRFHFVVMSKGEWINPELAAVVAHPDTQLIPFLERIAPAELGPLATAHSITLDGDTTRRHVKTFEVVFGTEKKVLCRLEIAGGGKKVSVHWSRPDN